MAHELKDIMTDEELAEILGCAVTTLEEANRDKRLVGVRFGTGGLRYTREAVLRQLTNLSAPPAPPPAPWGPFGPTFGKVQEHWWPDRPAVWMGAVAEPARGGMPPSLPDLGRAQ